MTGGTLPNSTLQEFTWSWQKKPITVVYEVIGSGQPILLLPAFSSISSRSEMYGLASELAQYYQVVIPDWVGFGDSSRPRLDYRPALYHNFLKDFVRTVFDEPVVVIAAGHAAGYAMQLSNNGHGGLCPWSWVVLVAPTWRGPLPTMMGDRRRVFRALRSLIYLPLMGQFLYWLNTTPIFLRWMAGRHVLTERAHLTRDWVNQKWRTTQKKGARFGSAAFVTGSIDPVHKRSHFFDFFQPPLKAPVLVVIGEQAPPKSLEEMEMLVHFSGVGLQQHRMPGSLGLHEEYPEKLTAALLPFLRKYLSGGTSGGTKSNRPIL
ncbi:alpha/beta hydrolase [Phormidium tenue FACHB-886]|nr:alpha/beta hydrolase [Phormidium tenue FACHB-886]